MSGRGVSLMGCLLAFTIALGAVGTARANGDVEAAGSALVLALPAVSAGASLIHRDSDGFVQLAGSAALALGITYGLKYVVNAERPNGGDRSLPSGHASLSFCSAEFLRRRYGLAWGAPAYAVAGFVGYSRVDAREHYTADVMAGALIGAVSAWALTRPYEHLSVDVTVSEGSCGLVVAYIW
ncbi:MAG: phosphatase PAP2 family protein [Candidatus Eisenbacteria bacterium]